MRNELTLLQGMRSHNIAKAVPYDRGVAEVQEPQGLTQGIAGLEGLEDGFVVV